MPRRNGLRIFLKNSQFKVDIGPCRLTVEFSVIEAESWSWELDFEYWRCSGFFRMSTDRDLKHHGMHSAFAGSDRITSIVWLRKSFKNCVSLLVSMSWSQKLIKRFVPEQLSPSAFVLHLYFNIYLLYCCYRYHYQADKLLHSLERAAAGIGLYVNAH